MPFNLSQHLTQLTKTANYEGAQGYFVLQRRAWQNCVRCKLNDKKSAHAAWQECLDEYQKTGNNLEWASAHVAEKVIKSAQVQVGTYGHRVQRYQQQGLTVAQAVMRTLVECQNSKRARI